MITIAIVEDNTRAASLLASYLDRGSVRICAIYGTAEEALKGLSPSFLPDIMLVDIGLPGMSGIDLAREIKSRYPRVEIIIQTIFEDSSRIIDAIKAGASGYVLKGATREEIHAALSIIKEGGSYLSGGVARKVLDEFRKPVGKPSLASMHQLTSREQEVLKRLIAGDSYKVIADSLALSIHTVNNHIRHIYEKLQVSSRGEAVSKALSL